MLHQTRISGRFSLKYIEPRAGHVPALDRSKQRRFVTNSPRAQFTNRTPFLVSAMDLALIRVRFQESTSSAG